mmetsp:Transcript_2415/g.3879  ORF Transcript_2415/g.3879 Transcript_2415/m.3879 type:complete len:248 (-) Transcript_2415:272-1015(-)
MIGLHLLLQLLDNILAVEPNAVQKPVQFPIILLPEVGKSKTVDRLGHDIADTMANLCCLVAEDASSHRKQPNQGEGNPDRKEGDDSELEAEKSSLGFSAMREVIQPSVLLGHNVGHENVSNEVPEASEAEPGHGRALHVIPRVEVGDGSDHEHSEDEHRTCDLIRCTKLKEQVHDQQRTGQHIIRVSVVAETDDEGPDVLVVMAVSIGDDLSEIADGGEKVDENADIVLLVVSGEVGLLASWPLAME